MERHPEMADIPGPTRAAIRSLRAVARRLDRANQWDVLMTALQMNRRIWARMEHRTAQSVPQIPQPLVVVGQALAAAGSAGQRLNDHDIQAIINFNRRAATVLATSSDGRGSRPAAAAFLHPTTIRSPKEKNRA
jgi:hypothetical protein